MSISNLAIGPNEKVMLDNAFSRYVVAVSAQEIHKVKSVVDLLALTDGSVVDQESYFAIRTNVFLAAGFKAGNYLPSMEFRQLVDGICDFSDAVDDFAQGVVSDSVIEKVFDSSVGHSVCPHCGSVVDDCPVVPSADLKGDRLIFYRNLYRQRLESIMVRFVVVSEVKVLSDASRQLFRELKSCNFPRRHVAPPSEPSCVDESSARARQKP